MYFRVKYQGQTIAARGTRSAAQTIAKAFPQLSLTIEETERRQCKANTFDRNSLSHTPADAKNLAAITIQEIEKSAEQGGK